MPKKLNDHDILLLLPRAPQQMAVTDLQAKLVNAGFEITTRSLQRRLIVLSLAHQLACNDKSKPYGWSHAADSLNLPFGLSIQEAVALKLTESYLADVMPSDLFGALSGYFGAANTQLKTDSAYAAWINKVRVVPATQVLTKQVGRRDLHARAYEGVLRQRVLHVTYQSRSADKPKSYDVYPEAIVVRGNTTYLIAKQTWAEEPILMALHKFTAIKISDEPAPQSDFNLDEFISQGKLGFVATAPQTLRLHFYNNAGEHLAATPLAAAQTLKVVGDGQHKLTVKLPITEQLKWWLFGFGDRVEVLAPKALRAEFAERLRVAGGRYGLSK